MSLGGRVVAQIVEPRLEVEPLRDRENRYVTESGCMGCRPGGSKETSRRQKPLAALGQANTGDGPGEGKKRDRSFRWSFRQVRHHMTGPYRLDDAPNLTSKNDTERDPLDGPGSTSNPQATAVRHTDEVVGGEGLVGSVQRITGAGERDGALARAGQPCQVAGA
jgi:hypothetical protein